MSLPRALSTFLKFCFSAGVSSMAYWSLMNLITRRACSELVWRDRKWSIAVILVVNLPIEVASTESPRVDLSSSGAIM